MSPWWRAAAWGGAAAASLLAGLPAAPAAESPGPAVPFGTPVQNLSAPVEDQHVYAHALLDEFEGRFGSGANGFRWDGEAWVGSDTNRVWLKSEGFAAVGRTEGGQHELLYDRPISPYFDLQTGVRYDLDSSAGRGWAAIGVEGLAPQFFEVSATAYASDAGHFAAKLVGSYEELLTQRLIAEPLLELDLYSRSDPQRQIGAGLSELDAGVRLRYEIVRKFAPYLGVTYDKRFGQTATFARANAEPAGALQVSIGIRMWL
ncbi:MAG: copper resistance protein B [Steroidobacteraceae bacterium]